VTDPITLRRDLHRHPELSGSESHTAERILDFFQPLQPDQAILGLGGHGLAFVFTGEKPGPTVQLRCELDALPIQEVNDFPHRSSNDAVSHKCGHDGHMAIVAAVGAGYAERRPHQGRVVLLYQPAEETGSGAAAVLADDNFQRIVPDCVLAPHNLPGFPLGQVIVRAGAICCASKGVVVRLQGRTAHAADPGAGISPARAMCRLIEELERIGDQVAPTEHFAFATVVGARLGAKAFGTAPGDASIMATLRSETDTTMLRITEHVERTVKDVATTYSLHHDITYEDIFPATVNSARAVDAIRRAVGNSVRVLDRPLSFSEDFGRFTAASSGALFGIGSGEHTPSLHSADYDFPDELIAVGASTCRRIVDECLTVFANE
jgi:amidohydrolase